MSRDFALPAAAQQLAAGIRLIALDVDGTLTDGRLVFASDGSESKAFHVHDGLGLKLLQASGIAVALVTARRSPIVAARAQELGIEHLLQGSRDKAASLREICAVLAIPTAAAAFMGDDLPDLPAMTIAGLAIAPADAHPWVRERVHWVTRAEGGRGAAREACDGLLLAQGLDAAALARYLPQ